MRGDPAIDTFVLRATARTLWVFLRLRTPDGRTGWGEATLGAFDAEPRDAARLAVSYGKLIKTEGKTDLWTRIGPHPLPRADAAIVSALDQAMWDIAGQASGQPIHRLLGATDRKSIPLYANINRRTADRSPAGFARSAETAVAAGFDWIKIAPFDGVVPGRRAGVTAGLERIAAVRDAIGPARMLLVDCHWRLDEAAAGAVIDDAAAFALHWLECPIEETPGNFPAIRRLRDRAGEKGILLAGCESESGLAGFKPFIDRGLYDVIMPDVKYAGGMRELQRIAAYAAERSILVSPHNPSGPVAHAVSLHASAGLPGFLALEHQFDETPMFDRIVAGDMPKPSAGLAPLPAVPGLGIALLPKLLDEVRSEAGVAP